jgi:predicted nuclease of predicted toxin-antitoxin system
MSIRVVIDMNLSPAWVQAFVDSGMDAVHWSAVGDPRAPDREILAWANANESVVLTHDLDFTTILALTHAVGPSVVLLRAPAALGKRLEAMTIAAIERHAAALVAGAIVVVEPGRSVVRILPL